MLELLGVIGIAISVAAYVPQVVHLAREHCSAGVSSRAWAMWLLSGLLVGLVALERGDIVFILLQLSSFTSAALILLLARRYKGMACETHAPLVPPRSKRSKCRSKERSVSLELETYVASARSLELMALDLAQKMLKRAPRCVFSSKQLMETFE